MANLWALEDVLKIVLAFALGTGAYFFISPYSKDIKKKQIESVTSLLINFVIYIWVGKIIFNFTVFIREPLTILAYPSDKNAFNIALLLISIHIFYLIMRKKVNAQLLFVSFVPIFIFSSFMYEFMQIIWGERIYTWGYLSILLLLSIGYMSLSGRMNHERLAYILLISWMLLMIIIKLSFPYITIFGYLIQLWILVIILVLFVLLFMKSERMNVT